MRYLSHLSAESNSDIIHRQKHRQQMNTGRVKRDKVKSYAFQYTPYIAGAGGWLGYALLFSTLSIGRMFRYRSVFVHFHNHSARLRVCCCMHVSEGVCEEWFRKKHA